jgi:pimeloyl-ACP methyl ester carboxylesterase
VKEAYVKRMPNAELVGSPDAHHALPIERPDEFNRVLAAFLTRHT